MSDNTRIEWSQATWNPISGCTKVSSGCDHCYIERTPPFRMARRRFDKPGVGGTTGVVLHADRLGQPLSWRKPRMVFVNSLADLFHEEVPGDFIARIWAVMAATPQHTYQILTKRHARMRAFLNDLCQCGAGHPPGTHLMSAMSWAATKGNPNWVPGLDSAVVTEATQGMTWGKVLPNVHVGVSVENQKWADLRIPALRQTPAAVRILSCEPLLGALTDIDLEGIGWVIAGGESGPGARPMHPDWVRGLRDQCVKLDVPFFFKQWGEWQDGSHYPRTQHGVDHVVLRDGRHVEFAAYAESDLVKGDPAERYGACVMSRVGKKNAGRELDGRIWDEFPVSASQRTEAN